MKQSDVACTHENFAKSARERNAAAKIDDEVSAALQAFDHIPERRLAFEQLIAVVRSRTPLLKATHGRGSLGWAAPVFLIKRLRNLTARQRHWMQPCETWRPVSGNLRPAFRSLAQHLLARYAVPGFMDSVWDLPAGAEAFRQHSWYIRLGRGAALRHLNLPMPLTRRMEHHVRHARDDYNVAQALRYGEVRGLGAGEALAREIVRGRLGSSLEHPAFWRSVISFFACQRDLELQYVNPIIDFIHAARFGDDSAGAAQRCQPFLPNFSIAGRTMKSLLRLTKAWHGDLASNKDVLKLTWCSGGIQGYDIVDQRGAEQPDLHWTICELLGSDALYAEGRALHHCVYDYSRRCHRGEATIWSLRLRVNDREKSMATIQVDARRQLISQMRAKCNQPVIGRSREIIRAWAEKEHLACDIAG